LDDDKSKVATIIEVEGKPGGFIRLYVQTPNPDPRVVLEIFDEVRKRLGDDRR